MISRNLEGRLRGLAKKFPTVTVTGPRQSGKTTLCRKVFPNKTYVSLEAPDQREYASRDPRGFLADLAKGAILDEVQRVPELLSYLQGEVDERAKPGRFILTGSANFALLHSVGQSLAGRTAVVNLFPLSLDETRRFPEPPADLEETLWKGGYPAIFDRDLPAQEWLGSYVATYVERDVRQLLNIGDLVAFQTFLKLCAGRSGQLLNLSALASDCGMTHGTARSWISVLETSYIAFRLPPFIANPNKRLVKTPKLYFHDTGLLCYLLGIRHPEQIRTHPLRGAIFETWVASEILKARAHRGLPPALLFFRDRKGVEVDLIVERGDVLVALEAKSGHTVAGDFFDGLTKFAGLAASQKRMPPLRQVLLYAGEKRQERTGVTVLPWSKLHDFDWVGTNR